MDDRSYRVIRCILEEKRKKYLWVNMASPVLKSDASPQLVAQVQNIEDQSDKWADGFALAEFTRDVAVWGTLTQVIDLIEQWIAHYGHGSQEHREAMINLGRAGALLLHELHGTHLPAKAVWLKWTPELKETTKQAVLAAHNREIFISSFTMWHKYRRAVEILSPTSLRFSVPPSLMDRRIMAHQQGCRIPDWPSTPDNPVDKSLVDDPDTALLLSRLLSKVALEGALAMRYPDDSELLSHLRNVYNNRLRLAFRRRPDLDLGGYNLGAFRQFFAVLLSLCSVHEYLCDAWSKMCGRYPFESAVMVKSLSEWVRVITDLSGVEENQVRLMITDLSFGTIRPLDIYIHPFVPTVDGQTLFLIPHFILNSRAEENVLRVCSYARPEYYSRIANAKEGEMREDIKENVPSRVGQLQRTHHRVPLRKAVRTLEYLDRDAELDEGFQQLLDVREFLEGSPDFMEERGVVKKGEHRPNLSYAVIARDHIGLIQQQKECWLAEFDALIWALQTSENLTEAIRKLQSYEWLPIEGRDFTVRFESSSIAGVTIEAEMFHRPPRHA
ncbi:MAG TPA: hypothetical protein VK302_16115 [Terriglobales bacterium]|nr:hypothetical protein [Terriglobales bacterium]